MGEYKANIRQPLKRGQPPKRGQRPWSQSVLCLEVLLYCLSHSRIYSCHPTCLNPREPAHKEVVWIHHPTSSCMTHHIIWWVQCMCIVVIVLYTH